MEEAVCGGNGREKGKDKGKEEADPQGEDYSDGDSYFVEAKAFSISLRPSSISSPLTEWGLLGKRRRVTLAPIEVKILADSSTRDQGTH